MEKTIKREKLNSIVLAIMATTADKSKNLITLRCEKFAKELDVIAKKFNEEIEDINAEHATSDKDQNILHEEVIITDKNGNSRKEFSGGYKYTWKRDKERKAKLDEFWKGTLDIKTNVLKRNDSNKALYKQIIEKLNSTQLSNLAGIILDIPVDKDDFVDEEWIINFLEGKEETKEKQNGQASEKELQSAPQG